MNAQQSLQRSMQAQDRIWQANLDKCLIRIKKAEKLGKTHVFCPLLGPTHEETLRRGEYEVKFWPEHYNCYSEMPYSSISADGIYVSWKRREDSPYPPYPPVGSCGSRTAEDD